MRESEGRKGKKIMKIKEKEKKEEGGQQFLPHFIGVPTVGTRWTKE